MDYLPYLTFLYEREKSMFSLLKELVEINSHSLNLEGVKAVQLRIKKEAKSLKCTSSFIKTKKYADVLKLKKRPKAPIQILLMGHADTVYLKDSSFKNFSAKKNTFFGPGVADMKGGLVILLNVLEAIERSPYRDSIGWTALINGDEEIGSIGSVKIIEKEAKSKDFALVFEPAKEGRFVELRPGSTNYLFTAKGKSAHAGRDFFLGSNAIMPLAELALKLGKLSSKKKKIQVNVATINGGSALNIVPDACSLSVNVRVFNEKMALSVREKIKKLYKEMKRVHPTLGMEILSARPPKELTLLQKEFHKVLKQAGKILGEPITFTESGGVTDGNTIASVGVPTIDAMGVIGKGLHTKEEQAEASSLVSRAKLAALLIMLKARERL